jgi:hypothetical protein
MPTIANLIGSAIAGAIVTRVMQDLISIHGLVSGTILTLVILLIEFGVIAIIFFLVAKDFHDFKSKMAGCIFLFVVAPCIVGIKLYGYQRSEPNSSNAKNTSEYSEAVATIKYWNNGSTITKQYKLGNNIEKSFRSIAAKIRSLSISNVDSDVVSYYTEVAELFCQYADWLHEKDQLESELAAFENHTESPEAFAESFLRGMMGESFGKAREMYSSKNQLNTRVELINSQLSDLLRISREFVGYELRLRAHLSKKHRQDFPAGIAWTLDVEPKD